MRWLLVVLVACGGHPPPTQIGNHADLQPSERLDGFSDAALVAFEGRNVTAYAVTGNKLRRLGSVEVTKAEPEDPSGWLTGDWTDREHLFVKTGNREVIAITKGGIHKLPVLPADAFKTPKPKPDDDQLMAGGGIDESSRTGLVVDEGHAYWIECPWGYPYDGFQCEQYVVQELWPDVATQVTVETDARNHREWAWEDDKPAGASTNLADDALTCTLGPTTTKFVAQEDPEQVHSAHWVSATPPRLLVIYGTPGMDALIPSRWTLHDGCAEKRLAEGRTVEVGPDGLWISTFADESSTPQTVHRHDQALGDMPRATVAFRPLK
jgi:hypothetical protein